MHGLRNSRGIGRLLAAWLLLSFIAMAGRPLAPMAAGQPLVVASALAASAHEPGQEHCGPARAPDATAAPHADHAGHAPQADDSADAHGGHAPGSPVHCPLCLHAAAPPVALPALPSRGDAPGLQVAAREAPAARVRSDAPAPGRGPPAFS
jgi:hypothetical protein